MKKGYLVTNSSKIQYMLNGIEDGSLLVNNLKETPKKETPKRVENYHLIKIFPKVREFYLSGL